MANPVRILPDLSAMQAELAKLRAENEAACWAGANAKQERTREMDWNPDHIRSVRDTAEHKAQLIRELEAKPWRRTREQNDMLDTYEQLSRYCQRVLDQGSV